MEVYVVECWLVTNKLILQALSCKFESYWMLYSCGTVPVYAMLRINWIIHRIPNILSWSSE